MCITASLVCLQQRSHSNILVFKHPGTQTLSPLIVGILLFFPRGGSTYCKRFRVENFQSRASVNVLVLVNSFSGLATDFAAWVDDELLVTQGLCVLFCLYLYMLRRSICFLLFLDHLEFNRLSLLS